MVQMEKVGDILERRFLVLDLLRLVLLCFQSMLKHVLFQGFHVVMVLVGQALDLRPLELGSGESIFKVRRVGAVKVIDVVRSAERERARRARIGACRSSQGPPGQR